MKHIIADEVIRYILDRRKFAILLVFAFFCGSELQLARLSGMSVYEFILLVTGNHYYIIYFMLITYLFFVIENMCEERSMAVIRLQTIKKNCACKAVSVFIQTVVFVLMHNLTAFVIGIMTLERADRFQAVPISQYYKDTFLVIFTYKDFVETPMAGCMISAVYMIFGFCFLALIVNTAACLIGKKAGMIVMVMIFLNIIVGWKNGISGAAEIFFLNHYIILHHVMSKSGIFYAGLHILTETFFAIAACRLIVWQKGNHRLLEYCIRNYSRMIDYGIQKNIRNYSMIFVAGYVGLNLWNLLASVRKISAADVYLLYFLGYSTKYPDIMELIRYELFFILPVFFLGMILEQERQIYQGQCAVRYGSREKWNRQVAKSMDRYLRHYLLYYGSGVLLTVLIVWVTGGIRSEYVTEVMQYLGIGESGLSVILAAAPVLKVLELYYRKELFLLWNCILKNNIAAYVLTFSGTAWDFVFPQSLWISYGSSSIYHLAEDMFRYGKYGIAATIAVVMVKIAGMKWINRIWRKRKNGRCCGITGSE